MKGGTAHVSHGDKTMTNYFGLIYLAVDNNTIED